MSTPAISYRIYHADSNTLTALSLFTGAGLALTAQSTVDGTDDPAGWKSKVVTFANPTEAVFITPTWQTPASPLPVYLTRVNGGVDTNVMDESTFTTSAPGRPSPRGEYCLQYTATLVGTVNTWAIVAPLAMTPKIIARTRDPLTGERVYGNDFRMLWGGKFPENVEVQCDVEDITDPAGWFDVAYTNVTEYAEASTGKALIKLNSEIIPQDGLSHALRFRIRYHFGGDLGAWVTSDWMKATYALVAPNPPTNVTANVLRDRSGDIPDRVTVSWQWATTNAGDSVEVYAIDHLGKKHLLGDEDEATVTSMTVENVTRFYTVPVPPAVQTGYKFGVLAKNRSSKSDLVTTVSAVLLTSRVADTAPPTPDEIAGTAETVTHSAFVTKASAAANALTIPSLTVEQKASLASLMGYAVDVVFETIKSVVMRGGSVAIDNFGTHKARWSTERLGRNPSTGESILIPASRQQAFTASVGYKEGTAAGTLMTDAEAKALP
jgi:DNA-binding protein HU-beta